MQLKHQNEMLQEGKPLERDGSVGSLKQVVQEAVDATVQEMNAKHAKEIAELKATQQEILRLLKAKVGDR